MTLSTSSIPSNITEDYLKIDNSVTPIRIFKYVRHEDRDSYERDGWIFVADLGPTHGHYAVLMEKIEPES